MENCGENNQGLPEYVIDLVNAIAKDQGFTKFNITPYQGTNVNDGFMSFIQGLAIQGEKIVDGNTVTDELKVLAKMPPSNKARRAQFGSIDLFLREAHVYMNLLPAIEKFQRDHGIQSNNDGFFGFPKCYGILNDVESDELVIIMEDIRPKGYKMWNKFKPVNYEHTSMVVKELAKYHAITFAMKEMEPEIFEEYKNLTDIFNVGLKMGPEKTLPTFIMGLEKAKNSLKPHEDFYLEKIDYLQKNFREILLQMTDGPFAEPFCVLNHGDAWINNMLFTYEQSENPNDMIFVDWQLVRYSSPILDLLNFIVNCTDQQLRNDHWNDLMQAYHDSFSGMLQRLSYTGTPFTFTEFKQQLKKFGKYGVCIAPMYLQVISMDPSLIKMDELAQSMQNNEGMDFPALPESALQIFNQRMSAVVRDSVRLGLL